ncbi:MAG: NUDIX domain-containing protein [Anaerolineales bacterium]|nr:NUDIX domain-containing protein [Anaerolineales bacterium]
MADISFDVGVHRFNYRVAAIIESGQRYLFTTTPGIDFWFLPGGRVKAGESSLEAIARELGEELGLENQAIQPLWAVENFFTLHDENFHELGFYFRLSLPPSSDLTRMESFQREPDWEFRWLNSELIQTLDVRPQFLKSKLPVTNQGFKHIIFKQEKQEFLEFDSAFTL